MLWEMTGSTINANCILHNHFINTEDTGTVPEKMLSGDFADWEWTDIAVHLALLVICL